jgi:hypothetical protein
VTGVGAEDEHEQELSPQLRELFAELETWLVQQPDDELAGHAVVPATRWVLEDVPGLDLARYTQEAEDFVVATPIWDRILARFPKDATYWMSQRLLMNEQHEPELDRARELLEAARTAIAGRAELLEREGFPRSAQSFRAHPPVSAGGEPPADVVWKGLALRIVEPFLQDPTDPAGPMRSTSPPPSEPHAPAPE